MISRIRLDAFGRTPDAVSETLYPHADLIEKMLGVDVCRGECVIERQLAEPEGSLFAFKGRLLLLPDISEACEADYVEGTSATTTSEVTFTRTL